MCAGTSGGRRCGLGRFTARAARSVATLLSGLLLALPVVGKAQMFTPTAPVPQPSAFFAYDNWFVGATVNNTLAPPMTWMNVPSTVTDSWTIVVFFKADDNATPYPTPVAKVFTILGNCVSSACTGGGDRSFQLSNPTYSSTVGYNRELLFQAKEGGKTLWQSPAPGGGAHTGLNLTPNTNYCAVISQYGADSSSPGIMSLSVMDSTGAAVGGSPVVTSTSNQTASASGFYYSAANRLRTQAAIGDLFKFIASTNATATAYEAGTAGQIGPVAMLWGVMPNTGGTPSTSVLQSLCNGSQDIKSWATGNGFSTIQSLYRLDDAGTWAGDSGGIVTGGATATGTVTQASPIANAGALTINDTGPGYVFSVDPGTPPTTGTIYFSGSYNSTTAGGTITGIDCEVLQIGSMFSSGFRPMSIGGGTFSGSISAVPAGTGYTQSCQISNSAPSYIVANHSPIGVGLAILWVGQSQQQRMFDPATTGRTLSITTETASDLALFLADTAPGATNAPGSHIGLHSLTAQNTNILSSDQIIGDGMLRMVKQLNSLSGGWPVMVILDAAGGHPAEADAYDYQPAIATLTGTGAGPFSVTQATMLAAMTQVPSPANYTTAWQSILKGSAYVTDSTGATVATDNGAGAFTGANVLSGSTINYLAGGSTGTNQAISSLNFSSAQSTPLKVNWTSIQDMDCCDSTQNNPYVGFGFFGDGVHPQSGYMTKIASRIYGPPSVVAVEQCGANQSEVSSSTGQYSSTSLHAKWSYIFGVKFAAFAWWNSSIPIMWLDYPRDTSDPFAGTAGCQQFFINQGALASPNHYGGSYFDDSVDTTQGGSPHEDATVMGGQRFGYKAATNIWALLQGSTSAEEAVIASAAFDNTSTYNAACAATHYSCIDITITLNNGTSIATCGNNLVSQTCTSTSMNGTVVKGFSIGNIPTSAYEWDGIDFINNVTANSSSALQGNQSFNCDIVAAKVVQCVKNSGAWSSGCCSIQYNAGLVFARQNSMVSVTINSAGSGQTDNTYTTTNVNTGSGCSGGVGGKCCTQAGKIQWTIMGGGIAAAIPVAPGSGCSIVPPVTLPSAGGAPGSATVVLGTYNNDLDDDGEQLYDNSNNTGGNTPGNEVTPLIIPMTVTG